MNNHKVKCANFEISNDKSFTLIAGPCQLENEVHAIKVSTELKKITSRTLTVYSHAHFGPWARTLAKDCALATGRWPISMKPKSIMLATIQQQFCSYNMHERNIARGTVKNALALEIERFLMSLQRR